MKNVFKLLLIFFQLNISLFALCQNNAPVPESILIFEEPPTFPGGDIALLKFIEENKNYPVNWRIDSIEGMVITTLIIDSSGNAINPKIAHSLNPTLDSIAITIIRKMPKWSPAKQRGQAIACQFQLPIKFGLEHKELKNKKK